MLTLRFIDGAAHQQVHAHDPATTIAIVMLDADAGCGQNDLHAAAHCASHMADTMQRALALPVGGTVLVREAVPVAWDLMNDGRILSPPVRPPQA